MPQAEDRWAVSYKTLFLYVALPILTGVSGFLINDLYANVTNLRETKVDRVEYYQDRQDIKELLRDIKQDLREHEKNARSRSER